MSHGIPGSLFDRVTRTRSSITTEDDSSIVYEGEVRKGRERRWDSLEERERENGHKKKSRLTLTRDGSFV